MARKGRLKNLEVREKILTIAIEVFVEKGYNANVTTMIAERAEISLSHMYIYFKDRDALLVEAILRMKDEHTAMSAEIAKKSAELDDERFAELFYEVQATIYHRVRLIINCMLSPPLTVLLGDINFDFSEVFIPFLQGWAGDATAHIARLLTTTALGYFVTGDINSAKAASLKILSNARLFAKEEI